MMYDEVDLEDIECRLYSQVYHCSAENEEITLPSESNLTIHSSGKQNNLRYFSKVQTSSQPLFVSLEEKTSTNSDELGSVYNSISFNPNSTNIATEGNLGNQFQNNITVNQYTVPLIINPELSDILNPTYNGGQFFIPCCVKNNKASDKKKKKRQRQRYRNKEKASRNLYNKICGISVKNINETVYVSDDSDSECVIVSDMYKKKRKSRKLGSSKPLNNDESDSDDIIYVPPPPVEIINVDEEDVNNVCEILKDDNSAVAKNASDCTNSNLASNKAENKANELIDPDGFSPESCASNDFLDNSSIDNNAIKFNFGLHGSDFNNTGDFVRPANPVEYCETESSCSTNDFNKEGNCVKTIVFSEVDFPREDIFLDKNLEGFGSYITPKRTSFKESDSNSSSKLTKPVKKIFDNNDSSCSSSETDCESPTTVNKNIEINTESNKKLPTLSPMLCDKNVTKTKNKKKHSEKRKYNTESDNDATIEEIRVTKKKSSKKKKKSSNKKTSSDDQNRHVIRNNENEINAKRLPENDHFTNIDTSTSDSVLDKEINSLSLEKENTSEFNKDNNGNGLEPSNANPEEINTNTLSISSRKKKKHSVDPKKIEIESTSNSSSTESNSEKVKKKKRKSLCSENIESDLRIDDINQSSREIDGISTENLEKVAANNTNIASNNPQRNVDSVQKVSEQQNENTSIQLENISESNNFPVQDSDIVAENCTSNEIPPVCFEVPSVHILDDNESEEEIVVVHEILSDEADTNIENCVEIVVSSDSEHDFQDLDDVGKDLRLANCSATNNEIIDVDNSNNFSRPVMNKNLCGDFSNFDIEQIQRTQTDNPNAWKILPRDEHRFLNMYNSKGPRCNRCRQFGHIAIRCTEKPHPPNCFLCGFDGHPEPRCPHKKCNQCGNEGDYSTIYCWKCIKFRNSICRLCNMRGHIAKTCPDLWRRYHLTTEEGPIVVSKEPQLKPRDQMWCSGCAGQGHLEHECNYFNREYPPTTPCIMSYEDVLQQETGNRLPDDRTITSPVPPPPVWNTVQQNHFYGSISPVPSFHNLPSTSQDIPPLMAQIVNMNPMLPAVAQTEVALPANINPNLTVAPTKVINPFSVLVRKEKNQGLNRMMLDYMNDGNDIHYMGCSDSKDGKLVIHPNMVKQGTNELLKSDQRRVKQIIMSMPAHVVKQFIKKELADLENIVCHSDPKFLKKQLFKYDRISQSKRALNCEVVKEKCFWYRILNMFIFGVHQFRDGKIHINFMKRYVSEPKHNRLDNHKRKSLLNAYNYIFDANRHINVNYYKIIQKLIQRYNTES